MISLMKYGPRAINLMKSIKNSNGFDIRLQRRCIQREFLYRSPCDGISYFSWCGVEEVMNELTGWSFRCYGKQMIIGC